MRYDPTDWMQIATTFYFYNSQIIKSNRRWKETVQKQHMSNPFHWPGKMSHRCICHSHFVTYSLSVYQDKPSCPMCSLLHHEACQMFVLLRCILSKNYLNFKFQNKWIIQHDVTVLGTVKEMQQEKYICTLLIIFNCAVLNMWLELFTWLLVLHIIPCIIICTVTTKNRSTSHPVIWGRRDNSCEI